MQTVDIFSAKKCGKGDFMAHVHEITFYKVTAAAMTMEHAVYGLLGAWYHNGQILNDDYVHEKDGAYIAYVSTDDLDSLDERYANEYVRKAMEDISYHIKYCGELAESKGCCSCKEPSCYELYADTCDASSIICGDCRLPVPLYRLPCTEGKKDYFRLVNWTEMYMHMKGLWITSHHDRYTYRQLTQMDSALIKEGREICREMEKILCKPVYYNISYPKRVPGVCPSCGKPWNGIDNPHSEEYICETCRLIGMG